MRCVTSLFPGGDQAIGPPLEASGMKAAFRTWYQRKSRGRELHPAAAVRRNL